MASSNAVPEQEYDYVIGHPYASPHDVHLEVRAPAGNTSSPFTAENDPSLAKVNLCCIRKQISPSFMVQVSFGANVVLFLSKVFVFIASGSLSVLASLLDSSIDLLAQGVLMLASRFADCPREAIEALYPAGVSRIEPIGVLICAVIMSLGAFWVIKEGGISLIAVYVDGNDTPAVTIDYVSGGFLGALIIVKIILWLWCAQLAGKGSVSLDAVAQDHRNDVASNAAALLAASIASTWVTMWAMDPVGGILISFWIIKAWVATGKEQADLLVGKAADPEFFEQVRRLVETHDASVTLDTVRAYHFGPKFLVEIEIVMPGDTPLRRSHDVGILLQHKIEALQECERCFVHIDYEHREINDHDPEVPVEEKMSTETRHLIQRTVPSSSPRPPTE